MSKRHLFFLLLISIAFLIATGIPTKPQLFSQNNNQDKVLIAGRNVNMVSGTTLPYGDPWLQRQNEPSIAVSTRNPLHLLAGANDYRTVDIPIEGEELPGQEEKKAQAPHDAWLGVFKSFDGGQSWITGLLPGFPQDKSAEGTISPLKYDTGITKGFLAAADPVVRAGSNGLFYYSGIAFNRTKIPGQVNSVVFISRFIDNNNMEGGDSIEYIDTRIIADDGMQNNISVDKPWIAVDVPKKYNKPVTIYGQNIPAGNVYIAYSVFSEIDSTLKSEIIFRRSTDCGETWENPIVLSKGHNLNQAATIAIDPRENGHVYVAWRRFDSGTQGSAIIIARSITEGKKFETIKKVASLPPFPQGAFDQPSTPDEVPYREPNDLIPGESFRTNSYPTMAIDEKGTIYLAWAQRGYGPAGEARILLATSRDGIEWTSPAPIDNLSYIQGHQFMPSLTFASGKITMVWYDQRDDYAGQRGFWDWINDDLVSFEWRHTIDVWAAQADTRDYPYLNWKSTQVSRYLFSLEEEKDNPGTYKAYQAQFNPPNYPLFKSGTIPFHGDYIDVTPSPMFVLDKYKRWHFNTEPTDNPLFHVSWTDNRDVRPPSDGNWENYVPATSDQAVEYISERPPCQGGQQPGMRNQNIYTSRITTGIETGSPTNTKALDLDVPRAFVIFVKNNTEILRSFRLTITDQPPGGRASFLQFDFLDTLDVSIAPYSTISRQVFVGSTDLYATVIVNIDEINEPGGTILPDGIKSSVLLNGDPTSPGIVGEEETHQPEIDNPNIVNWFVNPNIVNPNIVNPNIVNPNIVNPNIVNTEAPNPNIVNPNIVNPNIVNPDIETPNIVNPNIVNPNIVNPNIVNASPDDISITDVEWPVRNAGNTTSSFTFRIIAKESLPEGIYAQLIVYKVHYTPAVAGEGLKDIIDDCTLKLEPHHEVLLNVVNPNIVNPNIVNPNIVNPNIVNAAIENATFVLGPGEEAIVNLRIIDTSQVQASRSGLRKQGKLRTQQNELPFDIQKFVESVGGAVTSQSADSEDAEKGIEEPPSAATMLIISTSSLPPGIIGAAYPKAPFLSEDAKLKAVGGTQPYSWWVNPSDLPLGLILDTSTGQISGLPTKDPGKTYPYTYHFTVQVTDSGSPQQSDNQSLSITIEDPTLPPPPLSITTSSPLPPGTQGKPYGKTLEASGGVWPYLWTLVSGSLPPGLGLDSGGFISGTPATEGAYSFRIKVTDSGSPVQTAEKDFSLTIQAATAPTYTISGTVTIGGTATPLPGVLMRGLPTAPTTNASGFYSDTVPEGWSGTVTPFKAGYEFSPSELPYTDVKSSLVDQNYSASSVELNHFDFSSIDNQAAGTTFPITITAKDSSERRVTTYTDSNTLTDTTGTISPVSTGPFTNGEWSGQVAISRAALGVKITTSGGGKTGESNAFDVTVGGATLLRIEDAANGMGTEVNTITVGPGYSFTVYAISKNIENKFIDNVAVNWSLTDVTGGIVNSDLVPAADNKSATFTAHSPGTAKIRAEHVSLGYDTTGTITVAETVPDDIYEPNNNIDHAATIAPGTYTNLVLNDEDWFKFYISAADAGKDLKVHLKGTSYPDPKGYRDLDFAIFNDSKKLLGCVMSSSDDETLYIADITAGLYYIGLTYLAQVGTIYSMTVEVGDNFGIGYISGQVTDEEGYGLENVFIEVRQPPYDWGVSWPLITTDSDGKYKIGYSPGEYTVFFNSLNLASRGIAWATNANYLGDTYDEMVTIVASTTVSGIDAQLEEGGAISGRVTDRNGNGLDLANISAYNSRSSQFSYAVTNANGEYFMPHLRTGNYKVRFRPPVPYGIGWYENAFSFEEALPVPVQAGSTTYGIDAKLGNGGTVTGRVTDSFGTPIQGVQVTAYDVAGISLFSSRTGPEGYYGISRLPAGPVKIFFNASTAGGNYVSEYYSDKLLIREADSVSIQEGQTTYSIDAQLAAGGTITGRVTDAEGKGLSGVSVTCFDTDSDRVYSASTDDTGNYTLAHLLPDSYKVRFSSSTGNYALKWYSNVRSFDAGAVVSVAANETVTGIDTQLTDGGGSISGRVTTNGTSEIEGVYVVARDSTKQTDIARSITAADGTYTIPHIPAGEAKVYSDADINYLKYISEYYDDQSSFENAIPVSIILGQTTTGIDAVLASILPLTIMPASLPSGQTGVPYSASLQASGGREFYYWSVVSGSLPPGLTLNGKGMISGIPEAGGTFNFTVRVTDSTNPQQTATQSYTITIQAYTMSYPISGRVTFNGSPLPGVIMSGLPGDPVTNDLGEYAVTVSAGWSGTVTPSLTGYCFNPVNRSYITVVSPYEGQDYTASVGYDISGTVTLNGSSLQGVLISGLRGDPRTNANGFYTASVPNGWSGTVTPTLPGFTFTPGNRSYSSVTSHQTGQDYIANFPGGQDDAFEQNDNFASAAEITLGAYTDLVLLDEDWFKVYISAADTGKILKVHLKGISYPDPKERKDLDFMILNSSGKLLSYNLSGGDDETAYICDLAPGWYYIGQKYIGVIGTVYSMRVEVGTNFGIGYIEGRMIDERGQGIENAYVELYGEPFNWDICRPLITTDANGYYKVGFVPGNYTVRLHLFNNYHRDPYLPDVNYIGKAYNSNEVIAIIAGTTVTGINAKLLQGGTITGRVTDPQGNGLFYGRAEVYASDNTRVSVGLADANGYYTAERIRTGNYKVRFHAAGSSYNIYSYEWYENTYSFEDGLPVPVQAGFTTPNINAQLEPWEDVEGYIEGHVTDSSGAPIQGMSVTAYDGVGYNLYGAGTDENGYYRIRRLAPGLVKIFFNASHVAGNYVSEYYPDKFSIGEAVPILVEKGKTASGIDAQLAAGGTITGRVTDAQGNAHLGILVVCFDIETDRYFTATTDASGNYTLANLLPDDYKVRFRPGAGNYAVEWYNDKGSFADGDVVSVAAGAIVSGIDAQLIDNGGFISGRVTNVSGAGIEGLRINAYDSVKQAIIAWNETNADGYYTIPRIPTCQAKVNFFPDTNYLAFVSEYYNDKSSYQTADLVAATQRETTQNINAVLAPIPVLAITTSSLPSGQLAVPYNVSLQAIGGRQFYCWSIISGALPHGLTLNSRGEISGTPTALGFSQFTVRVLDSSYPQQESIANFEIRVDAYSGSDYAISGRAMQNGSPLAGVTLAGLPGPPITNPFGEYAVLVPPHWSGTVIPTLAGYAFDPASRTYDDVTSSMAGQDYIVLIAGSFRISTSSLPSGTRNFAYSTMLYAINGVEPYSWSILTGRLPDGLTLGTNGVISGTPTEGGDFSFTVRVIDSSSPQQYAARSFGLNIAPAHQGFWSSSYPLGGLINHLGLALDPSIADTLYVAPRFRGLYKSQDGGGSWLNITDNIQTPFDKTNMRIFLVRSSNEFYTVGHTGIFKSTNAGLNWVRIGISITNLVTAFTLHPTDINIMYAGTQNGEIFKSSDGGSNWSGISAGLPAEEIRLIAINPHDTSRVYAGTLSNGIYRSINDGMWSPANGSSSLSRIDDIVFDPVTANTIYIAANDASFGYGIYKTVDGGSNWAKVLNAGFPWEPGYYIAIDPVSPNTIYIGFDSSIHKSTDGGTNWTDYPLGATEERVVAIVIDLNNRAILYAGTEGDGVFKSTDSGVTWTEVNNGIRARNFSHSAHSIHVDTSDPNIIYAGSTGQGYRSTDGGDTWQKMDYPEGWEISSIVTHPGSPGIVFTLGNRLWKSENYGSLGSWLDPTGGAFCCAERGDLAIDPGNPDVLYAGVISSGSLASGVHKSIDGGSSWTLKNSGLTNTAIDTVAIHPTNSSIVYASSRGGTFGDPNYSSKLFKTEDGGESWRQITCGLPSYICIYQIVFCPGNPNRMYMSARATNGGVYKSDNGGECWYRVLSENVYSLAVHPNNANIVYAGTWNSGGFYISLNGGQTWTQLNSGLPLNPVILSIALDPINPNHVFIGTGGGAYEATLAFDFAVTTAYLPTGIVNEAYSRTIEALGGTLPYTWEIVSSSLPSGLALNSTTGEIAGVPTAGGNFGFTVKVTDNDGRTFRKNLTLTIYNMFTLNVTANPPGGGSVSKTPDNARYLEGSFVDVSATPTGGYIFTGWSGDAAGRTPLIHVQMTRDKTITANFTLPAALPDYYISSSSWPDEAGAGEVISGSVGVTFGNQGAGDLYAGDISIGLYLSSDAAITTNDVLLWKGRSSISALGGGALANLVIDPNLQIPTTVSAGNYYIGVLVDDSDVIAEREETNNSASQAITISSAGYDHTQILGGWPSGAIYGIELDSVRKLAVVGNGGLFQVLNISNPAYPTLRSELSLAPAQPIAIKLVGTRAFVASGGAGLKVIDISDSFHPTVIGSCTAIETARSLDLSGNYAYVTDMHQGLRVIDISNPAAPFLAAFLPMSGRIRLIKVSGNYAYVWRGLALNQTQGEQGIQIVDISNPSNPIKKSLITLISSGELDVDSSGRYLFVPVTNNYLRVYNVSNPDEPFEAAVYTGTRNPAAVTIVGNYAYVPDQSEGKLVVLDITDPLNPTEVSTYRFTIPVMFYTPKVAGNLCFVPSWYDSLRIVDFSNLNAPWEVGYYECFGLLSNVDVSNNHAYIANTKVTRNRLKVLDISDLANISETATLGVDYTIYDLVTSGAYAYLAAYTRGFRSIDISNPSAPVEVGANENLPRAQDIAVSGHYAFVADGSNGLRVLDISNPANPALMSTLKTPGTAYQISLCGKYAYLAAGTEGLRVIDISDPLDPWEKGFYKFSGTAYNVNVGGGYAYVNDSYNLLRIVDVSNPSSPVEVGTFNLYYTYGDIGISGNFLFVPDWAWGLRIIDVSNPASPVEVEVLRTLGTAEEVVIYENRIYVINRDTGFYVFELRRLSP